MALQETDAFHAGEVQAQERAGVRLEAGRIGRSIHAGMVSYLTQERQTTRIWPVGGEVLLSARGISPGCPPPEPADPRSSSSAWMGR